MRAPSAAAELACGSTPCLANAARTSGSARTAPISPFKRVMMVGDVAAGALFEKMAKIELTHVPYRGTAQSTLDLLEGRVEMQFGTIPPALAHIRAGKLRALAVTGAVRNPTLPDVPTIAESGLPGYECSLWQAIVAPAATSPTIIARLNREIGAVLADPDVRAAFAEHGVEPQASSATALGARIRADVQKWREVIISAGIREN